SSGGFTPNGTPVLWDIATGKKHVDLPGMLVFAAAFHPVTSTVQTLSIGTVPGSTASGLIRRAWDPASGAERGSPVSTPTRTFPISLAFSRDGSHLAFGTPTEARVQSTANAESQVTLQDSASATVLVFGPDGATLAAGSPAKGVRAWDTASG